MTNPTVATPPTVTPVTISEAKAHLRVDIDDDDALILSLIKAATAHCERIARRSFVTQTLDLTLDYWPAASGFCLPRPPIQSVTSITYTDEDGNSDTVSSSDYIVDTARGKIALKASATWPAVTLQRMAGVVIRYVAGYGAAAAVPADFKQAVLLVTGDWYENRENMIVGTTQSSIEFSVKALLFSARAFPIEQ